MEKMQLGVLFIVIVSVVSVNAVIRDSCIGTVPPTYFDGLVQPLGHYTKNVSCITCLLASGKQQRPTRKQGRPSRLNLKFLGQSGNQLHVVESPTKSKTEDSLFHEFDSPKKDEGPEAHHFDSPVPSPGNAEG